MKKKIPDTSRNIDLQSQAIYDDKENSKKTLHILEDNVSGVQVSVIEQATLKSFVRCQKLSFVPILC